MAKPLITEVTTNQTFQQWLAKTNELVGIFQTNALTASGAGDTTEGDATLVGDFTATNLISSSLLSTNDIASRSSGIVNYHDPIELTGTSAITATFSYGSTGGQVRFTDGTLAWDAGLESSNPGNFIINTGVGQTKFELSTAGTLTVPNIKTTTLEATGTVTADSFIGDGSGLTNVSSVADLGDLSDVTITTPSTGQVLKYDGTKWVNGADATSGGAGLDADTLDGINSTQFLRSDENDTYTGTLTVTGDINQTGTLTVTGLIRATGNIITNYSASDVALKDNLQTIDNALDKVSQISGYTFNYIDKPEERVSGIIAQEIEQVLPEVVFEHERNNGTYKAVRYDGVIPLLLEAIKELKDKVNDLENRLESSGN